MVPVARQRVVAIFSLLMLLTPGLGEAAPDPSSPRPAEGGDEEVMDDPEDTGGSGVEVRREVRRPPAPSPARQAGTPPAKGPARKGRPANSPDGDEPMDDPEDVTGAAAGAGAPGGSPKGARPGAGRGEKGGAGAEEGMDDPEDAATKPRPAAAFVPRATVGGFLQLWTGFDLRHEGRRRGDETDLRPSEDIFELAFRGRIHAEARFARRVKARLEARLLYWVTSERPSKGKVFWFGNGEAWETRGEVELGEAYVDLYLGPVDLRLGQQIVTWGLSELVNPNDVVNPLDIRRGLFGFDEDRRLPVLAARAAWHFGTWKLEGLWLPLFRAHRFELWGSDFALFGPGSSSHFADAEARLDRLVHPTHRGRVSELLSRTHPPPDDLSASSAGLRLSGRHRSWDFGLQYFFGWDRTPGVKVDADFYSAALDGDLLVGGSINLGALGALFAGRPLFESRYHHGHQLGLSLGKAFESIAVKLDVSYFPDRGFLRTDRVPEPLAAGLVDLRVVHHTLITALSIEYAWGTTLMVQVQGLHGALLDRRPDDSRELMGFLSERQLALVLGFVRVQLLSERLLFTLGGAVDVLHGSFLLAPAVAYKITDAWRVSVGGLFFEGGAKTLFGSWTKNDLLWCDVRWHF